MTSCPPNPSRVLFREIKFVRQEPSGHRRWFESAEMELVVWFNYAGGATTGFQIIYWLGGSERALTWRSGEGFSHNRVDNGDDSPMQNMAPILCAGGTIPWAHVEELFLQRSDSLPLEMRELVVTRLKERK